MLCPLVDFALAKVGLVFVRFCDDYLFIGDSPSALRTAMEMAERVLRAHGLEINPAKTEGPTQQIIFLGVAIDSIQRTLKVPLDKVDELRRLSLSMVARSATRLRHIQSLVGKFSFVAAVLPGSRPFFRSLIDATKGKSRWEDIAISATMKDDLRVWSRFLKTWNRGEKWQGSEPFVLEHDASKGGFGFLLTKVPPSFDVSSLPVYLRPGQAFAGYYSARDIPKSEQSIQWGEMLAMAVSLTIYAPFLRNSTVLLKTDNIADVFIIRRQSTRSPPLLALLRCICLTCAHFNITIRVEHVPGQLNTVPDYLSRPELHQHRATFVTGCKTYHTQFIHSSSFQPGEEAHLAPTFSWMPCWG